VKEQNQNHKQYLVCGMGNPVLTDDAVGLFLVRDLEKKSENRIKKLADFIENHTGYMDLFDYFSLYRHILVVDSMESNTEKPGTLIICQPEEIQRFSSSGYMSVHGLNLPEIIALSKMLETSVLETCTIAGITVTECRQFGTDLSSDLKNCYPDLLCELTKFIENWLSTREKKSA